MKENMLLTKTCSIYASDVHFATMIFPFIHNEIKNDTIIRTILEKDEQENIERILENVGLNSEIKKEIKEIDWKNTNISKIRNIFKLLEKDIENNKKINLIINGRNTFIEKVNRAVDLWFKNNMEEIEKGESKLNILNCFSFEQNKNIDNIIDSHEYILKTAGIEEIIVEEELLKAN